jgi:hypothetical protein
MAILSSLPLIIVATLIIWGLNREYNLLQCFNGVLFYLKGIPHLLFLKFLLVRKKCIDMKFCKPKTYGRF